MSLIQIDHLSFTYEGSFDPVFENMSFQIDTDWKLGFIGRNGKGKTTFLKLLMHEYEYTGSITASVDFEYFPYPVEDPSLMTYEILEHVNPVMEQWELIRDLIDRCADHVLVLNRQSIEVRRGNFSSWYADKCARDELERRQNENLKKDIHKLKEAARQAARWSDKVEGTKTGTRVAGLKPDRGHIGHQAAKMMKRAKSLEHRKETAVREKEGLREIQPDQTDPWRRYPPHRGNPPRRRA